MKKPFTITSLSLSKIETKELKFVNILSDMSTYIDWKIIYSDSLAKVKHEAKVKSKHI